MMGEQALEVQGVAALIVRRKMLKAFEVVRRKMGIDDVNALPPPQPPSSSLGGGPPPSTGPASATSTKVSSVGTGGGLTSAWFSKEQKTFSSKSASFFPFDW